MILKTHFLMIEFFVKGHDLVEIRHIMRVFSSILLRFLLTIRASQIVFLHRISHGDLAYQFLRVYLDSLTIFGLLAQKRTWIIFERD